MFTFICLWHIVPKSIEDLNTFSKDSDPKKKKKSRTLAYLESTVGVARYCTFYS
jgi:hypothetical protein